MMQRKNKRTSQSGYGSGYESNDNKNNNNNININNTSSSSPSKPPAPPHSGGISIGALTGHKDHNSGSNNIMNIDYLSNSNRSNSGVGTSPKPNKSKSKVKVALATVKRNRFGTQPFDEHWLNLDCCGLICAGMTYSLHAYGAYAFGWILLPPWFSTMDEDGYRELSFGCHFHRTLFITIAFLAVFAHFKAMTTDPGAVPPDATPLPDVEDVRRTTTTTEAAATGLGNTTNLDELDNLIKGENNNKSSPSRQGSPSRLQQNSSLMQESQDENVGLLLNNGSNNGNNNGHSLPQAVATAGAVGAAVVGGAAVAAGAAAMTVASAAAPQKPAAMASPGPPSQQQRGRRMCRRCQAFKPPRAHHCSICKRCIIKMDHHCPWVNNCVGIGNHKYFLLFIFYTSISCGYSFFFLLYRFFHCIGGVHSRHSHIQHGPRCVDHPTDILPLVGLTVEALLFGLFTLCMMVDQWDVVMTNLTHIDRLKGESHHHHQHAQHQQQRHAEHYGRLPQHMTPHFNPQHAKNLIAKTRAGINEVFGTGRTSVSPSSGRRSGRFHFSWLSPLHKVCFPDHVRDDILGYCRPCGGSSAANATPDGGFIIQRMEMVGRGESGRVIGAAEIV